MNKWYIIVYNIHSLGRNTYHISNYMNIALLKHIRLLWSKWNMNNKRADALIACGKNSTSYAESKKLYKAFQENNRKTPLRMVNSPFLELDNISSVLSESPERLAVSLQYFLQGIGLLSAMPLRSSLRSSSISSKWPEFHLFLSLSISINKLNMCLLKVARRQAQVRRRSRRVQRPQTPTLFDRHRSKTRTMQIKLIRGALPSLRPTPSLTRSRI